MNTRVLATQLIDEVLSKRHSLSHVLPIFKNKCKSIQDAAFMQALAFGVIRWYPRLLFTINHLLQKPLKSKNSDIIYVIAVGLFQLMEMQVAHHAAISETVEAVKLLNKNWATALVNAVLRSYQRQRADLEIFTQQNEEACYAHPQWLINAIKSAWPLDWQAILTANNQMPPLSLRVNVQKESREDYIERLKMNGISAKPIALTRAGIIVKSSRDVTTLPGYQEGLFSVQDGAAQFAAELLQLSPHLHVLDACAAPGGKTTHILELEPKARVVAIDISAARIQLIKENLKRLQLNASVMNADVNSITTWWDNVQFDRILVDAPCSATGVIRRHPDIKYLRKLSDVSKLVSEQLKLLNSLWPLLKSGGILVYATCSIFPEENLKVMQTFLAQHKNASDLPISIQMGKAQAIGHQLLPGQNDLDGFYYARVRKN